MSGYGLLAGVYDRLMDMDYGARAAYLLKLFERHGQTPHTLLDLACGSGTLTWELAGRGYEMIGVDGSADMLALAQEKAVPTAVPPLWLCQDMRELDLYGTVNGAVCTLDSLNHLCRTDDVVQVLRRLSLFIEPQGLLIFDVNTPYKHREVLADNAFVYEWPGAFCVWQNHYTARTGTVHMWIDLFTDNGDGLYEREQEEITERAYSRRAWERMLKEAQFEPLAVYADMTTESPTETTERWVIVARNVTTNYD